MYDLLDSSSGSSSSDSEGELDVLLLELATTLSRELGPHVSLDDISEIDCKLLFRYINRDSCARNVCVLQIVSITLTCFLFVYIFTTCQLVPFTDLKRSIFHASRVPYNYQDITYVEMARVPQPWRLY